MIKIIQNNPYTCKILYYTEELDGTQTPKNLNGYTIQFIVKKINDVSNNDTNALIKKEQVLVDTDAINGIINFSLLGSETNINTGNYKCEFQIKSVDNTVITLLKDDFIIEENYIKQ